MLQKRHIFYIFVPEIISTTYEETSYHRSRYAFNRISREGRKYEDRQVEGHRNQRRSRTLLPLGLYGRSPHQGYPRTRKYLY